MVEEPEQVTAIDQRATGIGLNTLSPFSTLYFCIKSKIVSSYIIDMK